MLGSVSVHFFLRTPEGSSLHHSPSAAWRAQCIIKRSMADDGISMVLDIYVAYIHASRKFTPREELIY